MRPNRPSFLLTVTLISITFVFFILATAGFALIAQGDIYSSANGLVPSGNPFSLHGQGFSSNENIHANYEEEDNQFSLVLPLIITGESQPVTVAQVFQPASPEEIRSQVEAQEAPLVDPTLQVDSQTSPAVSEETLTKSEAEEPDPPIDLEIEELASAITSFGGGGYALSEPEQALLAPEDLSQLPDFAHFASQVVDGQPGAIRGLYVEGLLALRVVDQPPSNIAYVSNHNGTATHFRRAADYGVTGLLAHNHLSGRLFYNLVPGHEVRVVYGDGNFRSYQVMEIHQLQRLNRTDIYSNFVDLSNSETITSSQVFQRYYKGDHHLTLQTCLEGEGYLDWGIYVIIATPIEG